MATTIASYAYTTLAHSILADSPVGLWPLNESTGINADDLADSHDGTHEDTDYVALGQTGVPGADGQTSTTYTQHVGGDYGGKTSVPDHADWDGGSFTLETFLHTTDSSAARRRIIQCQPSSTYWFLAIEQGLIEYGGSDETIYNGFGTTDVRDDNWHHLCITRTQNDLVRAYVDGVLQANTLGAANTSYALADEVIIGNVCDAWKSAAECVRASLTYVSRTNSALTGTRIAAHSRKGLNNPYFAVVTGQNSNYGQEWKAGASGLIDKVTLYMHKVAGATGTVTLKVCTGTSFSSPLATSAPLDVSTLGTTRAAISMIFPVPFWATNATTYKYWLEGTSISGTVRVCVDWDSDYADGYAFHFTTFPTTSTDTYAALPFIMSANNIISPFPSFHHS